MKMLEEIKTQYQKLAAKKRAELESAIESRQVADPISWTAVLVGTLVSAAASTAAGPVARARGKRNAGR